MIDHFNEDDRAAWNEFLLAYSQGNIDDASKPKDIPNIDRYLEELGGWLAAPLRSDENNRMKAFERYSHDILQAYKDSSSDLNLDKYTRLAATLCDTPISLLNILDSNTQWVTSEYGLSTWRNITLPRSHTFCAHTILRRNRDVFIVTDAKNDWRFEKMPMVCGPPYIQWYMGAPLTTSDGQNIGALCVLDTSAVRPVPTEKQKQGLVDLADTIMKELDLRADRLVAQKAKKMFISSISHELRSPLHGLMASAELMVDDGHLTPFQDVCTRTITSCGKTLCDVIEHVLSLSDSTKQKKMEEVPNLSSFVEEILDATWAGKAELKLKNNPLEVLVQVNLTHLRHPFKINRGEIGRIVMNLFGNAIKYTAKGHICVRLRADRPPFHRDGSRLQYVTISFEDTGKGIDPSFMPKLFEPFVQQNHMCEGFGLGMSLVKQLVERNSGTIDVQSVPGKGTTVTVNLLLEAVKANNSIEENLISQECEDLQNVRFAIYVKNNNISELIRDSVIATCESTFNMTHSSLTDAEIVLLLDADDLQDLRSLNLTSPIVIFAPEAQQSQPHPRHSLYLQVPIGPFKLGRAIKTALSGHEQSMYHVRRSSIVHLDPVSPPTSAPMRDQDPLELPFSEPSRSEASPSDTNQASSTSATTPMSETSSFSFGRPRPVPLQTIQSESNLPTVSSISSTRPYCLCVDDNAINVQILAALLSKEGLSYETAVNGQIAVDKYINSDERFDAIFMDINMPIMGGIEATKLIRDHESERKWPRTTIVALTGGGELEEVEIGSLGIDQFFKKPVSMKDLSVFLRELEEKKRKKQKQQQKESKG